MEERMGQRVGGHIGMKGKVKGGGAKIKGAMDQAGPDGDKQESALLLVTASKI